ncbi:hypothetical protein LCGC14_0939840 [marine sediment metagenome]|uniref:beta-N-acetylhexosaminidase n=2 Tax=root TaxID=1 RepID=A0A831QQV7_9FLAO|nr:glycoside hydrolase family 3 protein [Pricia sp.]HEA21655.1 glycoside hydrolase family 3 protein [Pricia antarctica]
MLEAIPYTKATELLTKKDKIGQLFMPSAFINDTESEIQEIEKLIREEQVGSLCFFHSRASAATNFEGLKPIIHNENSFITLKKLIGRYQQASKYPLLIAIDAEWGLAMRIENTPQYPYAITLGALPDSSADLIYDVGKDIALDCKKAGIHWNLAPCVDINNNPNNPVIGYRSFGENKFKVTQKALAYIKGTQDAGILTSIKHFPGHGDTDADSHLELPLIDKTKQELLENELFPFQKLIDEGVDSVMVGHLSVPALANGSTISSSISKEIIKGMLRNEMGYKGVVISDALNMHAVSKNYTVKGELAWLAFDAGNDVLCFAEHIPESVQTILAKASEPQIEESFRRIWQLKEKVFAATLSTKQSTVIDKPINELSPNSILGNSADLNRKIAMKSLTLVKGTEKLISDFKGTNFVGIQFSKSIENQFFKNINQNIEFTLLPSIDSVLNSGDNILLALFPPQVKPNQNFGFTKEELIFINELVQTKNVVLYLFGNPYVLQHIDVKNIKSLVLVYQDFDVFQEVAAEHFLGNFTAQGKLSVSI